MKPKNEEYDPIHDIYQTVQLVLSQCVPVSEQHRFGDSKAGILRNVIRACHKKAVVDLKEALQSYNSILLELKEKGIFDAQEDNGPRASNELIQHIFEQAYARSIAPLSHLLNNYQGFSNNVYGEINYSFVRDIIKNAPILPSDVFLDLGSGIGNVVLQVAAECLCESYGIEIMENPSQFAKKQRAEFLSRMRFGILYQVLLQALRSYISQTRGFFNR
jgi:hypothetical protein